MVRIFGRSAIARPRSDVVRHSLPAPSMGTEAGGGVWPECKEVVERVVERTVTVTVRAPVPPAKAVKRPEPRPPSRADEWVCLLAELTKQVNAGRVYARDLPAVEGAVGAVQPALARRRLRR